MIFRLLIVDDEATMRKGLSSFVNWESIDCIVSGTACDGADAIEQMKTAPADIVITDIKMPDVDGLGLSKFIYENYPETAVILLTGYAEFEYAQTAIRYNVSHFLLKPTSKDEIISAVKDVQQKIIVSKKRDFIAKSELSFLKDQVLQELTCSGVTGGMTDRLRKYGITLNCYYVAAFQVAGAMPEISQLKELIIGQEADSYCFRYNNLILSIYYEDSLPPVTESCGEIIQIAERLYSMKVSAAVSGNHRGAEEFSAAASEAIHALSLIFYAASPIAIFDGQCNEAEYILSAEDTLSLYDLETAILQRDFPLAQSIVSGLFMKLKSSFANASDVKNICSQIYYLIFRVMAKFRLVLPPDSYLSDISHSTDIFQLEGIINKLLSYAQKAMTSSGRKYSPYIRDAIAYIRDHLAENITLNDIAQHIHMNSSYLSRTFKKECGYSVTEYITVMRMEKAKELLANSSLLTYEVAEATGIHDASYFSLLFKKHTGLSPKEYKNQFIGLS